MRRKPSGGRSSSLWASNKDPTPGLSVLARTIETVAHPRHRLSRRAVGQEAGEVGGNFRATRRISARAAAGDGRAASGERQGAAKLVGAQSGQGGHVAA